ncbi:MAG TPA: DUF4442 domain-containing protein [Solirubrobacterales bacterium]|nr:DUF4442 domain-containing protein [Solirubrobacterales bacterium]
MTAPAAGTEAFVAYTRATIAEVSSTRVVVEQPAAPELDNHVGVRHASALHSAGYEASRALVAAALGERHRSGDLRLEESEISYTAVGLGPLTTTAEPTGEGWDRLPVESPGEMHGITLTSTVTTTNEEGKVVARLRVRWALALGDQHA